MGATAREAVSFCQEGWRRCRHGWFRREHRFWASSALLVSALSLTCSPSPNVEQLPIPGWKELRPHPSRGNTEPPHWWGGVLHTRAQITGSPSSLISTHQHIDVLLLREEGTHFLHISTKDGLDQGRLQGEPVFRERAGAEPGSGVGDTGFGRGATLEGLCSGVLAAGGFRGVPAGHQAPKDTGLVEGSAAWGGAGAPGSGPA